MYAIIETGGKQYRVDLGTELEVERLAGEPGREVVLDRVLLVADGESAVIGRPLVAGAEVRTSVVRQDRGEKIVVFKYKAKTRHRTKRGHRQELTVLRVADIVHDGRSAAQAASAEAKQTEAEREKAAVEAAEQAARDAALAAELAAKTSAAKAKAKAESKAEAKAGTKREPKPKAEAKTKEESRTKPDSKPKAKTKPKAEAKTRPEAKTKAHATDQKAAAPKSGKGARAAAPEKTDNTKRPVRRPRKES